MGSTKQLRVRKAAGAGTAGGILRTTHGQGEPTVRSTLTYANGHPVEAADGACSVCGMLADSLPTPTPPTHLTFPGYQVEGVLGSALVGQKK